MTVSPDVPRPAFEDLAGAIEVLREQGLRLSTARRLVLQALFATPEPVSAQQLAGALSLEESSVYRNLELLERYGMVRHVHLGHSPGLYVLAAREDLEYLYCEACGAVTAVAPGELDAVRGQIRAQFGHSARFTHFAIVGLCRRCAGGARDRSGDASPGGATAAAPGRM